jgi:hypothetical protein
MGIDTKNALSIKLIYKVHGYCVATITLNNKRCTHTETVEKVDLFSPITLSVDMSDFHEGTSGIEIAHFSINDLEILPKYQHLSTKSTNYIDFYEHWELQIPSPFYVWYHEISGQGWIA